MSASYLQLLTDWGEVRPICQMEIKAMKTTQAWGWLTAGVLALGLNGFYHDGGAELAHRIVGRVVYSSTAVVALASGRAAQFLEQAKMVAARNEPQSCPLGTAMARIQAKVVRADTGFARFEAMSAREEAQLARVEANRARIEALAVRSEFATFVEPMNFDAPKVSVICPRVRVNIPRMPMIKMQAPVVHVGTVGTGPV
jgi:hypothetical protein